MIGKRNKEKNKNEYEARANSCDIGLKIVSTGYYYYYVHTWLDNQFYKFLDIELMKYDVCVLRINVEGETFGDCNVFFLSLNFSAGTLYMKNNLEIMLTSYT